MRRISPVIVCITLVLLFLTGIAMGQPSQEDPFLKGFYDEYYGPRLGEGFVPAGYWQSEAQRIGMSQAIIAMRSGAGYFSTVTDRFVGLILAAPGDPKAMTALQTFLGSESELMGLAADLGVCDKEAAGGCHSEAKAWLGSLNNYASIATEASSGIAGIKLADLLLDEMLMTSVRANLRLDRLKLITLAQRFTLAERLHLLYQKAGRRELSTNEARELMALEQEYYQVRRDSYDLDARYWQNELKPKEGALPFTTHSIMDFFPGYDDPEKERENLDIALSEVAVSVESRERCEALYRSTLKAAGEATAEEKNNAAKLFAAVDAGDITEVDRLLYLGYDPNPRAPQGYTPLMRALRLGKAGIARRLIKGGADVNATDGYGRSVLDFACCTDQIGGQDLAELVTLLIDRGADPHYIPPHLNVCDVPPHEWYQAPRENCADYADCPGIQCLVLNYKTEALQAWVDAGAPVDEARNPYVGSTALQMAAALGNADATAVLLAGGADPNAVNWTGHRVLMFALPTPVDPAEQAARKAVVAQRLLAAGATDSIYTFWADLGLDPSDPTRYAASFQQAVQNLSKHNNAMAMARLMQDQAAYAQQEAQREAYRRETMARNHAARRAQIQRRMDVEARRRGEASTRRPGKKGSEKTSPQNPTGATSSIWSVRASFTDGCILLLHGGHVSFENGGVSCDESGRFGPHQMGAVATWSHSGSIWNFTFRFTQDGSMREVRCTANAPASARSLQWTCRWVVGEGHPPSMRWERR